MKFASGTPAPYETEERPSAEEPPSAPLPSPSDRIGIKAIRSGFATEQQISRLLEAQSGQTGSGQRHVPLGALMLEQGVIEPRQLLTLLDDGAGSPFHLAEDAIRLAARLQSALGGEPRLVLFTGPSGEHGVSTVASQVALPLALMGKGPVLLLDANFRSPSLHARFHAPQSPGLVEILEGRADLDKALFRTGVPGLHLLPAGQCDADLPRLLLSEQCAELFELLRKSYRLTIVDAPPLLQFPESGALAARADGVVAVVATGRGRRSEVVALKQALEGLRAPLLGVVLTEAAAPGAPLVVARGGVSPFLSGGTNALTALEPNRRITVVHLLHTMAYGGIETNLINWSRAVDRDRIDLKLVCFANPGATEGPFIAVAEREGLSVRTIPWARHKPVFAAARALEDILRDTNADILHTHNVYADLVGLVAARRTGVKSVSSQYVWSDFGWKRNVLQFIDSQLIRHFDLVTCQCDATLRDTSRRGVRPERLRVLISGIERDALNLREAERLQRRRLRGISDEDVILVNVSRLYPEKAQAALIRCMKRIHKECPTVRLWILGVGPLENRLRALCQRLGLQDATQFLGHVDDLRSCLSLADIQVHPSFAEGVPLAVCEGMAVGLPVVASAVGGLPEIVQHGHSGVLIPAAKAPGFEDAFVEAVVRLARDPNERAFLGRNARHFVENEYSIATAVSELERVYRQMV